MSESEKVAKTLTAKVKSNKADKTLVVYVERKVKHKLGKFIKRTTKYYVHDEKNAGNIGDTVLIRPIRPRSKLKRWELVDIIEKASIA